MRARWHLIAPLMMAGALGATLIGAYNAPVRKPMTDRPEVAAVPGDSSLTNDLYYMYFKTPVELQLEYGRIAASISTNTSQALADHGFAPVDVEDHAITGIKYLYTQPSVSTEQNVRQLVGTMAADAQFDWVSPVLLDERGDPVLVTPHLHIAFADTVSAAEAEALIGQWVDGEIVERDWAHMDGVYRVLASEHDGFKVLEKANWIARRPEVRWAEPDLVRVTRHDLIPNDPSFGSQWGLHNTGQSGGTTDMDMDCPEAWDLNQGDSSVYVVVLDDGVQQDHPDINQRAGADFTGNGTNGGPGNDCDNHGTAVAGCISATINNSTGVAGAAPGCRVASAKWSVSNTPCDGGGSYQVSWLVSAIDWADTIGATATNNSNSFGSQSSVTSKYEETRNNGIAHFTSSGNDGTGTIGYPGSLPTVNAVGAIDRNGNRASFSTYGTGLAYVAPGVDIYTTDRTGDDGYGDGDYGARNGTSFSSPYAAAVAGLIRSQDDTLTVDEVETILENTCTDRGSSGWDQYYGFGIVNAHQALIAASAGGGYCAAGSGNTADEYIANVTVGVIDNDSGRSSYSNFTAISTPMAVGVGYPFTVTNGETFSGDQCGVWVDWNQDEDFDDPNETITVDNTPGQDPFMGVITPPVGALEGDTRLRIRVMYTGAVSPCGNTTYGEVEDYTITCEAPDPCPWDTAPEGGDGTVGLGDLNGLLSNWGPCAPPCPWDFAPEGGDGTVGLGDLNALLSNWGPCP
jgi:subtilisin family serine protease